MRGLRATTTAKAMATQKIIRTMTEMRWEDLSLVSLCSSKIRKSMETGTITTTKSTSRNSDSLKITPWAVTAKTKEDTMTEAGMAAADTTGVGMPTATGTASTIGTSLRNLRSRLPINL